MTRLPSSWGRSSVEDGLATVIDYRGKTPPKSPSGIPLISAANVKGGRIVLEKAKFISPETYSRWTTRGFTRPGDVLITTEAPAGEVAPYPAHGTYQISRRVMALRADESTLHHGFLLYALQSRPVQQELLGRNRGTTVPRVLKPDILGLQVPLPPLPEQRRIAAVLGALDDKIELNRQMNRTLEAMAQAIFKSWFIDFDGHDDLVDSELGPIPRGWDIATLGDVAAQYRLMVQPGDEDPDTPYVGLADMPLRSIALGDWGAASDASSTKALFGKGDILFGKLRPYFKKVAVAPCDGVCSSDIIVVRPNNQEWFSYVLGLLTLDAFIDFTTAVSTGTRMPRVSWKAMAGYGLALPTVALAQRLDAVVRPAVARINANIWESQTLATLRDTLLPKLISGEIRVPEAEQAVEQVL